MKLQVQFTVLLTILSLSLASCGILHKNKGVVGKASIAEDKAKAKIELVDNTSAQIDIQRLNKIGVISSGVSHALIQDTNQSPAVIAAETLNDRIMALANKPDFKEAQAISVLVDELIHNQAQSAKDLAKLDKQIEQFAIDKKDLEDQKTKALNDYYSLADKQAAMEDQYKATLGQMDSFLGLGAVFYGLKKFFISSMWILGIGGVLFLILRIAAMSNPIAASVFSIFDIIGSWVINAIKVVVPKAVSMAGHVTVGAFNEYKSTLTKVVDAVQMAKNNATAQNRSVNIEDIMNEAAKTMNDDEKAIVEEIKKALNWK